LIALKLRQGVSVQIVFLTDGSRAPLPQDGSILHGELPMRRVTEARLATHLLGMPEADLHFFGLPDNSLRNLAGAQRAAIIDRLQKLFMEKGPGEIYVPHEMDGHEDHEAAYDLVSDAVRPLAKDFRLLQYMIWRPWLQSILSLTFLRDLCSAFRLPIDLVVKEKTRAIEAYSSQVATLPAGFLARFYRPYELFVPRRANQ
jgi:LmbE family N-acetylglucosaminyl deacetylase